MALLFESNIIGQIKKKSPISEACGWREQIQGFGWES
jgi:hypothetical protein